MTDTARIIRFLLIAILVCTHGAQGSQEPDRAAVLASQATQYRAQTAKTIVELQQFRQTESIPAQGPQGQRGTVTLINLNPDANAWFLLILNWGGAGGPSTYHLENPKPRQQAIHLSPADTHGIELSSGAHSTACELWSAAAALAAARRSGLPYAPLCGGALYLRNPVAGRYTALERVSGFLRDHVWGGEEIVGLVRKEFFTDKFLDEGMEEAPGVPPVNSARRPDRPLPATLDSDMAERAPKPRNLGIGASRPADSLMPGRWYPAAGLRGVYISFLQPRLIAPSILNSYPRAVNRLDDVEASAMVYSVAFDLADFDLGFTLGTDHPRVGWSPRPPAAVRNGLPGPDGIGTAAPLITNGLINPVLAPRTIAAFTGGFKREHGAFRYGPLALVNHGSHYGFIEQGVVFSKLEPGLSTLYVLDDGTIDMKTWTQADDALLSRIRFARQNGVPLIEYDSAAKTSAPGPLVARWGPGNWSGSADMDLRSLRAGACLQETATRRFLIYGYFSSATPSAMARVFQAYGCKYAMHLDMNAPELTYLAVYLHQKTGLKVEYLAQSMAGSDQRTDDGVLLRFLTVPDNRDFFYLIRRSEVP